MDTSTPKLTDNDGMTLIELTFAAGVLAVALSLLFGSLISINVVGEVSRDKSSATAEMASIMEDIRRQSFDDLLAYTPPEMDEPGVEQTVVLECFNEAGDAIGLPMADGEDGQPVDVEGLELPNPVEIKATLVWTDVKGRAYSMHATTLCER
ncbi:MAG: hypothetical protein HYV27_09375 [Candidatus Hydrogenedentes bacterium]|nr:hypothetical protein [Candidatus Hydrogenedentota bacterium]